VNLYKISQTVNDDDYTFDSAVVCAESGQRARQVLPVSTDGDYMAKDNAKYWCKPEDVVVQLLGKASDNFLQEKCICSSFSIGYPDMRDPTFEPGLLP